MYRKSIFSIHESLPKSPFFRKFTKTNITNILEINKLILRFFH